MTKVAEKLKEEVLRLPDSKGARGSWPCLIRSLDEEDRDIQAAWETELEREVARDGKRRGSRAAR